MSASRERKQRQASEEPVISSRAQEELEKAARRKRNTLIYCIIGVVVVILVAALLIWDSGVFQRNAKVAEIVSKNESTSQTINEKVTASQIAYYYYNHEIIYYSQLYSYYGMTPTYDYTTSPKLQTITTAAVLEYGIDEEYVGKTYHDYFLDYALDNLRQEYALCSAAKEAGYTLSDEGKESVEAAMEELDSTRDSYLSSYGVNLSRTAYLQMVYGNSMNEKKYRSCLENQTLAEEFYSENFDALTEYTDEELDAYYQEHALTMDTVHYYSRYFDGQPEETVDEEGNTVEATAEEQQAALDAALKEAEAEQAAVNANFDTVSTNDEYKELRSTPNISTRGYDWLIDDARQHGDTTILESGNGYYLLVFDERYLEESHTVDVRHILVEAVNEDDINTGDVDESTEDPTDEAFAAAKEAALALVEEWKAGGATEEAFAALAEEHSADTGSNTNGGLYENVVIHQMIPNFNDWIFAPERQAGDVSEPVLNTESTTQGWHIIYYVGQDEPAWISTAKAGKWNEDLQNSLEVVRFDNLDSYFS